MPKYECLSNELTKIITDARENGRVTGMAFDDKNALRRKNISKDVSSVWRPAFIHDVDKILHCPYYNRYTDKTQVFSLYKNDDLCRRSLHVQLVSRIARTIGRALDLNLDLIEAISLGHDMGHPPFAHTGEELLDELYFKNTGLHFLHSVQSVRVLDRIYPYNITLQTLDGILTHNGEIECEIIEPEPITSFEEFDRVLEKCAQDLSFAVSVRPSTLEGAVVRLSDIIAYLGKDRQDASRANIASENMFVNEDIGSLNAEIINNLVVNVIECSYGKPYIKLDKKHFDALAVSKRDNYRMIYNNPVTRASLNAVLRPMMEAIYGQLLDDLKQGNENSPVFTHHIAYVNSAHYTRDLPYESGEPNQIVVDYIASMTDSYFIDLHEHLFPESPLRVEYKGYFEE